MVADGAAEVKWAQIRHEMGFTINDFRLLLAVDFTCSFRQKEKYNLVEPKDLEQTHQKSVKEARKMNFTLLRSSSPLRGSETN